MCSFLKFLYRICTFVCRKTKVSTKYNQRVSSEELHKIYEYMLFLKSRKFGSWSPLHSLAVKNSMDITMTRDIIDRKAQYLGQEDV